MTLFSGKMYTALVSLVLIFTLFFDKLLKTYIFSRRRLGLFFAILTGLILIFNGYLTARPVVLYNTSYILNIRIWTIPVEDFVYGYTLILLCVILFERLKGNYNHEKR